MSAAQWQWKQMGNCVNAVVLVLQWDTGCCVWALIKGIRKKRDHDLSHIISQLWRKDSRPRQDSQVRSQYSIFRFSDSDRRWIVQAAPHAGCFCLDSVKIFDLIFVIIWQDKFDLWKYWLHYLGFKHTLECDYFHSLSWGPKIVNCLVQIIFGSEIYSDENHNLAIARSSSFCSDPGLR